MDGWISLHRKIRENPIFNDHQLLRLWLICLTEAYFKPKDQPIGRQVVRIEKGQFPTGRFELHEMYNDGLKRDQQKSPKTVWRWLETLKNLEFLTIKTTNKYSIVTIVNWDKYQNNDQQFDQQVTNKRPTNDQQMTTKNKDNNVNKDNNKELIYRQFKHLSLTQDEFNRLLEDGYTKEQIDDILDSIENYKNNKNYTSLNLTARKWLKKEEANAKNKGSQNTGLKLYQTKNGGNEIKSEVKPSRFYNPEMSKVLGQ